MAIINGIICAIFRGTLFLKSKLSKSVFVLLANFVNKFRIIFRITKSTVNTIISNMISKTNMFIYLVAFSEKPMVMI